jgi:uncharacterized membrane protein YesL
MSSEDEGGFFSIDGPFMRVMELVINMLLLNFIVIICSIPVITIGAAFTAMNHQLQRMSKNEEGYVVRDFFKDFKTNFKTSTLTWLIMLPVGLFLGADLYIFSEGVSFPVYFKWLIIGFALIYLFGLVYLFPVLARYETTPKLAIKTAYAMSFHAFPKTIIMIALVIAPWIGAIYIPNFILACFFFGITLPAYINVFLYRKTFATFEKKQDEASGEEE